MTKPVPAFACAFAAGLLFGFGLVISEMANPAKVLAFLDLSRDWDPSLAFAMGGALAVTAVGYRLTWRRSRPLLTDRFHLPGNRHIDWRLLIGAMLFGAGWGLAGLCPGPAFAAVGTGGADALLFLAAMTAGVFISDRMPVSLPGPRSKAGLKIPCRSSR